jgi:hypothetical protein
MSSRPVVALTVRRIAVAAVLFSGCTLSACTEFPKTADAFREQAASQGSVENFEVNRPLREVAATFRERAAACLQDLQTVTISGPATRTTMTKYSFHPTVLVTDRKVELHVRARIESGLQLVELPADGFLLLVTQAVPIDGARTRIEIYGSPFFHRRLYAAAKAWASGASTACPDMS